MTTSVPPLPFTPVLIAGAPRSGTHLLHSLVCTSARVNRFFPEFYHLYYQVEAYLQTLRLAPDIGVAPFADLEDCTRHHFDLIRAMLVAAWERLDRPDILAVKECSLTPFLGLMTRHLPELRCIVILRDPRDTIASQVRETEKRLGHRPAGFVDAAILRIRQLYGSVIRESSGPLGSRLLGINYEELVAGGEFGRLAAFLGVDDLDPGQLWQRASFDITEYERFSVASDLWGAPLSDAGIGRWRKTLTEAEADRIWQSTLGMTLSFSAL